MNSAVAHQNETAYLDDSGPTVALKAAQLTAVEPVQLAVEWAVQEVAVRVFEPKPLHFSHSHTAVVVCGVHH